MPPQSQSDEFASPRRSLGGRIAGAIEQVCLSGVRLAIPLSVPMLGLFGLYVVGGYGFITLGIWAPSYDFLSLTNDLYFVWLSFLVGCVICLGTGSLIGLAFLTDGEGEIHNEVSVLASFIGFGFGAGVIRMTYRIALSSVV